MIRTRYGGWSVSARNGEPGFRDSGGIPVGLALCAAPDLSALRSSTRWVLFPSDLVRIILQGRARVLVYFDSNPGYGSILARAIKARWRQGRQP
jgi:hypothetical protein